METLICFVYVRNMSKKTRGVPSLTLVLLFSLGRSRASVIHHGLVQVLHVGPIRCLLHRHLSVDHSGGEVLLFLLLLLVISAAAVLGLIHSHLALSVSFGFPVQLHQLFGELLVLHTEILPDLHESS